jgi:chaperonin GroES
VLIRRVAAVTQTKSGIFLAVDESQTKSNEGEVLAVGPGALTREGSRIPVSVKEGDKVLLPEYGGTKLKLGEEELFLFNDADLLGRYV